MNNIGTDKNKYKIANEVVEQEENGNIGRTIVYFGVLAIICILAFLVAKYIVRSDIEGEDTPIDTSERL